jgi:ADP-ribosylglycohydrolase
MDAIARAMLALEGLSVGDAFGEQLLHAGPHGRGLMLGARTAPVGRTWMWTDDTAMALSIVEVLRAKQGIDPALLAQKFAQRYDLDAGRGYGRGAHQVLEALNAGLPYPTAARIIFNGEGSCGNGGGMRSAPIGAYFADDLEAVVTHATHSAAPTHAHPDGVAGAVAIAVAAARVFAGEREPRALLETVIARTPAGPTRNGLTRAVPLLGADVMTAAVELGNGSQVLAADTIPFAVWCAATHLGDYARALWACGDAGGDIDTTCAIVGGIVVGAVGLAGIPTEWRTSRERLPAV